MAYSFSTEAKVCPGMTRSKSGECLMFGSVAATRALNASGADANMTYGLTVASAIAPRKQRRAAGCMLSVQAVLLRWAVR